jgi:hypothetical protein
VLSQLRPGRKVDLFIDTNENASIKNSELSKTTKKSRKKNDNELIDILQGEITSLKSMMEQKDSILEKMSHAFHQKESIITQLKTKLHNSTFEKSLHSQSKNDVTAKRIFQKSPVRKDTDSASERSLRSLAYLMQKTEMDKMRKTYGERVRKEISNRADSEGLSHSNTESLSGSSTTSIVGK